MFVQSYNCTIGFFGSLCWPVCTGLAVCCQYTVCKWGIQCSRCLYSGYWLCALQVWDIWNSDTGGTLFSVWSTVLAVVRCVHCCMFVCLYCQSFWWFVLVSLYWVDNVLSVHCV